MKVSLKVFDGAGPSLGSYLLKEQGQASLDQLAFLSLGSAQGNNSSSEPDAWTFAVFELKDLFSEMSYSTSVTVLGILWKLPGCMITHVISWRGWWHLNHSRRHPRCLFPNAEIYSSSFELFLRESFQFCGSRYKSRNFHCFRKPPGLRGNCQRLSDPQADHLYSRRAGVTQPGGGAVGFWLSQRDEMLGPQQALLLRKIS